MPPANSVCSRIFRPQQLRAAYDADLNLLRTLPPLAASKAELALDLPDHMYARSKERAVL